MENWNQIFTQTIIPDISNKKEESRISIINLEIDIKHLTNTIQKINNIINSYDGIIDDTIIKNKYNSINYDNYCKNILNTLTKYDEYYELYKIIETNNDIFELLSNFNNCVNKSCSNCVKHSESIVQLFSKLKINEECNLIKNKFIELHKNKLEYEQIVVFHNKLKLSNCNKVLELLYLTLENEKNNFQKLTNEVNDTTIYDFKMYLQHNIHKIEQNNYIIELDETNNSVNYEYLMLLDQINERINILEYQLVDINK